MTSDSSKRRALSKRAEGASKRAAKVSAAPPAAPAPARSLPDLSNVLDVAQNPSPPTRPPDLDKQEDLGRGSATNSPPKEAAPVPRPPDLDKQEDLGSGSCTQSPPEQTAPVPRPPELQKPEDLMCHTTLVSDQNSRDIQINIHSLSFRGEDYVTNSMLKLQYGKKYGLVTSTGRESILLKAASEKKLKIPVQMEVCCPCYNSEQSRLLVKEYVTNFTKETENIEDILEMLAGQGHGGSEAAVVLSTWQELLASNEVEERAIKVLNGLGFTRKMQQEIVDCLEESWHMPLALARLLILNPPFLLIDEPTQYLDLEVSIWLGKWLEKMKGQCILLVKSNDEEFLGQFCNNVISLTGHKLIQHEGKYADYINSKKSALSHNLPSFEFINQQEKLTPPILQLDALKHGYNLGHPIFDDVNISMHIGLNSKMALIGTKGSGKTTLLNILAGKQDVGKSMSRESSLRIAHFSQYAIKELDLDELIYQYVNTECKDAKKSKVLQYWLSSTMRHRKIGNLTHGQKASLVFACLATKRPHLLLIDDPTENMDIETIDSLAMALKNWNGAFVLVTNNMKLISTVACEIWVCGSRGLIKRQGDIMAFKADVQTRIDEMPKLEDPLVAREFFPQFAVTKDSILIKNCDVIHPSICYKEYVDSFGGRYQTNCIPLDEYVKQRAMVASAPKAGLKDGDLEIEGEMDTNKTYRMTTGPGKLVGTSLMGVVHKSKSMNESLADFDKSNVWVSPEGIVFLMGVDRVAFCEVQLRRNHMSAHKVLSDLYSVGGAIPPDAQHALDMIKDQPDMSHIYHTHAAWVPISQTGPMFMRMQEHLVCKITDSTIRDNILMFIPYVLANKWRFLFQDNYILIATFNYKAVRYNLPGNLSAREWRLAEANNFLRCSKNRVKHRMDYLALLKYYTAEGSDLAWYARFSLVNCVLQEQLEKAKETKELKLHQFL